MKYRRLVHAFPSHASLRFGRNWYLYMYSAAQYSMDTVLSYWWHVLVYVVTRMPIKYIICHETIFYFSAALTGTGTTLRTVPLCVDDLKETTHTCSACNRLLGRSTSTDWFIDWDKNVRGGAVCIKLYTCCIITYIPVTILQLALDANPCNRGGWLLFFTYCKIPWPVDRRQWRKSELTTKYFV